MTQGLSLQTAVSANDTSIPTFSTFDVKDSASSKIINYPMVYQGLAQSVLIDNQDAANSVTVRINGAVKTITIPASSFRAFNNSWIEQIELTGNSTDTQITAQVAERKYLRV